MTVLMLSLKAPPESELSSVPFKLIITPSGLPLLKSKIASGRKIKKIHLSYSSPLITPSGLPLHKSKMAFGRKIRK